MVLDLNKFEMCFWFVCIVSGFPAAAYAAYAAGRGFSGYPSFGLPYPTGNINLASLQHQLTAIAANSSQLRNNHTTNPLAPTLSNFTHPHHSHHHPTTSHHITNPLHHPLLSAASAAAALNSTAALAAAAASSVNCHSMHHHHHPLIEHLGLFTAAAASAAATSSNSVAGNTHNHHQQHHHHPMHLWAEMINSLPVCCCQVETFDPNVLMHLLGNEL